MECNKKDKWIVVDKDGKVYEKSGRKSYLIYQLPKLKKEHFNHDLKIIENGE